MDALGPVVIGPREIYDAVVLLRGSVERMSDQIADLAADQKDHEVRIRALEKGRWPLPAVALVLSAAALAWPILVR